MTSPSRVTKRIASFDTAPTEIMQRDASQQAIARWENEGGAPRPTPRRSRGFRMTQTAAAGIGKL